MKQLKYVVVPTLICLLIGVVFWWATSNTNDRRDPLNKSDAYVHSENGIVSWFEISRRNGKVEGKLHQQKIIEEVGKEPFLKVDKFPVSGEITKKGYKFKVKNGEEIMIFEA